MEGVHECREQRMQEGGGADSGEREEMTWGLKVERSHFHSPLPGGRRRPGLAPSGFPRGRSP